MKNFTKIAALALSLGTPALADDMMAHMPPVTAGDLTLTDGFAHATLPNQPVAGGFVTIANDGLTPDTLMAARSDIAGIMQLHEMALQDDTMIMREIVGGITVPPGERVTLAPGGLHLMFMQLNGPLVAGQNITVTLTFENAGDIALTLPIRPKMMGGHGMQKDAGGDN